MDAREILRLEYEDSLHEPVEFSIAAAGGVTAAPLPLVVFLHGCFREPLTRRKIRGLNESVLSALATSSEALGASALFAAPFGYGNTRFAGIGCLDVLRVIRETSTRFEVDADRISLIGVSMGGYGALNVAMENPGRFASVCTIGGYLDAERWDSPAPSPVHPWEEQYLRASDLSSRIRCLAGTRLVVRHAEHDYGLAGGVPVVESRRLHRLAKESGIDVDYREWPAVSHGAFSEAHRREILSKLLSATRDRNSACRGTWVGRWTRTSTFPLVKEIQSPARSSSHPEVEVSRQDKGRVLDVRTTHVHSLTLGLPVGIREVWLDGRLALQDAESGDHLLTPVPTSEGQSRDCGWIGDVLSDHVAFVVPSTGKAIELELFRELAVAERRRLVERNGGLNCGNYRRGCLLIDPPIMTDREFVRSGWASNAILYGRPGQNFALNALLSGTFLSAAWCRRHFEHSSPALRLRLPVESHRVCVATLGDDLKSLISGFDLDYGRSPGYLVYGRQSVSDWGFVTDRGLVSARCSVPEASS